MKLNASQKLFVQRSDLVTQTVSLRLLSAQGANFLNDSDIFALSELLNRNGLSPRASPWATTLRAVGAEKPGYL